MQSRTRTISNPILIQNRALKRALKGKHQQHTPQQGSYPQRVTPKKVSPQPAYPGTMSNTQQPTHQAKPNYEKTEGKVFGTMEIVHRKPE